MKIGYSDFIEICEIEDPDDFYVNHEVRADGVYVKLPRGGPVLTPNERSALTQHSTGNLNEATLPFPCSIEQFRKYLVEIDDCVIEENLNRWIMARQQEQAAPTPKFKSKSVQQDERILEALIALGQNPQALPKQIPGMPWVKSTVAKALLESDKSLFQSKKVFDKSWDRLRLENKIKEI